MPLFFWMACLTISSLINAYSCTNNFPDFGPLFSTSCLAVQCSLSEETHTITTIATLITTRSGGSTLHDSPSEHFPRANHCLQPWSFFSSLSASRSDGSYTRCPVVSGIEIGILRQLIKVPFGMLLYSILIVQSWCGLLKSLVSWTASSTGGGKISFGRFLDSCGIYPASVEPRFLSSTGVGPLPTSFAGLGKNSFDLRRINCCLERCSLSCCYR